MRVDRQGRLRVAFLAMFATFPLVRSLCAQADESPYTRAIRAIARRQATDDSVAVPGARSILLTAGGPTRRALVLLHGLTDSPRQFEALAYLLHADGNNVYVPRLPQHGLRGKDASALGALTATQLEGVADSVVDEARGLGDSIIVVGLSMGGTVAAWIAQQFHVARAVLIAPAIEPGRIPSLLDRPLIGLADRLPSMTRRSPRESTRPDREPGFNTRAVAELLELGRLVAAQADRVSSRTRSITLLVNASDRTVNESAAEGLARSWLRHGAAVSVYELPDSLRLPHNIIDPLRGRVAADRVLALLRDLAYGAPPSALVRRIPLR
jgi:esterase/lipase